MSKRKKPDRAERGGKLTLTRRQRKLIKQLKLKLKVRYRRNVAMISYRAALLTSFK